MRHGARVRHPAIEVALALTRDELDAASRLVHACYLRRGYVKPSADGRHINAYLAMPSTAVRTSETISLPARIRLGRREAAAGSIASTRR